MADYDFTAFGEDFGERLDVLGYSFSDAERQWPGVNRAMLSRARNGEVLSVGNVLFLCRMAGIDPFAYLIEARRPRVTRKTIVKQAVTRGVARETRGEACHED